MRQVPYLRLVQSVARPVEPDSFPPFITIIMPAICLWFLGAIAVIAFFGAFF